MSCFLASQATEPTGDNISYIPLFSTQAFQYVVYDFFFLTLVKWKEVQYLCVGFQTENVSQYKSGQVCVCEGVGSCCVFPSIGELKSKERSCNANQPRLPHHRMYPAHLFWQAQLTFNYQAS